MRGVIVAGTDTGVGKTLLSALLMMKMPEAVYWKPIQSGTLEETDSEAVARLSKCDPMRILREAYKLTQPLSPHLSARLDGIQIEASRLALPTTESFLIVELAGGVLVPLREDLLQIEMIKQWNLPVVVAARSTLGTINHSLLTLEALNARKINVAGIVMIGPENIENEKAITLFNRTRILGRILPMDVFNATNLSSAFEQLLPITEWLT